jgi:hypothetical protein
MFVKSFPTDGELNKFSRDATRAAAVLLDEPGHVVQRIDFDTGYLSMLSKIVSVPSYALRLFSNDSLFCDRQMLASVSFVLT